MLKILTTRWIKDVEFVPIDCEVLEEETGCYKSPEGECMIETVMVCTDKMVTKPVGCIALVQEDNYKPFMSYSVCAEGDQFSYKVAKEVMLKRAKDKVEDGDLEMSLSHDEIHNFPKSVRKQVASAISDILYDYNLGRLTK